MNEELKELNVQLEELFAKRYIKPNKSPYGAPVIFVHKKDGTLWMCVDCGLYSRQQGDNEKLIPITSN
jgi:hypothetical protein